MSRVPLSVPVMEGNERIYLNECIDSGFVSSVGPFVDRFEEAFAASGLSGREKREFRQKLGLGPAPKRNA